MLAIRVTAAITAVAITQLVQAQSTDPLWTIDANRAAIVQRLAREHALSTLPRQHEALTQALWQLRADRLLAASLAGSREAVEGIIADAASDAAPSKAEAKLLGDANADLTYTPVNPCRILDTRNVGGPLAANVARNFIAFATSFATQGGTASNCSMPNGVAAVAMNVYAVNPTNLGFIKVWAANAAEPGVSTVNYQVGITAIATGAIVPVDAGANNGFKASSSAGVDFVADVVGYFRAPTNAFVQGGNIFTTNAVIGTKNNSALQLIVNSQPAMTLIPTTIAGSGPSVILGVGSNRVVGLHAASTIGGGGTDALPNTVTGSYATVAGGVGNTATNWASVLGGRENSATGNFSTVAGGVGNAARGAYSFAAGLSAQANHTGCVVVADASSGNATSCFADNEIVLRGRGGFYFWTAGTSDATYSGARLAPGTGAWAAYSDRNGKHRIDPVDAREVLERLVAMPIATWQWKDEPGAIRHMGPMAQDFRKAFELGDRDTEIVTIDADGVALAAIQGLNAKLEEKIAKQSRELEEQRAEIAQLRATLSEELGVARQTIQALLASLR